MGKNIPDQKQHSLTGVKQLRRSLNNDGRRSPISSFYDDFYRVYTVGVLFLDSTGLAVESTETTAHIHCEIRLVGSKDLLTLTFSPFFTSPLSNIKS